MVITDLGVDGERVVDDIADASFPKATSTTLMEEHSRGRRHLGNSTEGRSHSSDVANYLDDAQATSQAAAPGARQHQHSGTTQQQ